MGTTVALLILAACLACFLAGMAVRNLSIHTTEGEQIMATLEELQVQVQATTDIQASAITLIEGIAAQLEAAKDDPEQIQALADQLKASSDALAAAGSENTLATPVPEAPPAEPVP